jgi:hypothetical protein
MLILTKYSHNTPDMCHFLIKTNKKNSKKKNQTKNKKNSKIKKIDVWCSVISQLRRDLLNFIARLGEFQFAIISLLISAGLKLVELQTCIMPNDDAGKK